MDRQPPSPSTAAAWWRDGLRAAVLRRPRGGVRRPGPGHLVVAIAAVVLLDLLLARAEVPGPAVFDLHDWLAPWWTAGAAALLAWVALRTARPRPDAAFPRGLAAFLLLWWVASTVPLLANGALSIAQSRDALPAWLAQSLAGAWLVFLGLQAWSLAIPLRLAAAFGARRGGLVLLGAGMAAVQAVGTWHFSERPWHAEAAAAERRPVLALGQETFEAQQAAWDRAVQALVPQRPGVVDLYGIVFSPYAGEDVFLRENRLVHGVLQDRFDARGRVLQLANHADTAATLPWATPLNLQRAVAAIAQRMDVREDVLVVYLTSHGAANFTLAAEHGPLEVPGLQPAQLRQALDDAGIAHRVVAVSACYSGGWVEPLAGDGTLVMTAADADHTSYGCGRRSELTFFGRALFDEELRRTRSFEEAFARAVPVIRRREEEAGKPDGFSNPQIRVGPAVRPALAALAQRLDDAAR